jgi:ABC-type Fe3+ transport system substrate-binding protein
VEWEFPGILGDLIGDLTWSPKPIEIKLFSTDTGWLMKKAPEATRAFYSYLSQPEAQAIMVRYGFAMPKQ